MSEHSGELPPGPPGATGPLEPTVVSEPSSEPTSASETEVEATTPSGPKLVKRIVCSYRMGWLPGDWLQTWRRLGRRLARAKLKVKATLAPLEDLPEDTDILVVPPDLREAARESAKPGTPILVTPASAAAGALAPLVIPPEAGGRLPPRKGQPPRTEKPQ